MEDKNCCKTGDRFWVGDYECVLAQVEANRYALICLSDGNRWDDPVTLGGPPFTKDDLAKFLGSYKKDPQKVTDIWNSRNKKYSLPPSLFKLD
jgi:hypothetical protein